MKGFDNAGVRCALKYEAKKTKRLHWLNFGLHFGDRRFTLGRHEPYIRQWWVYVTGSGGGMLDCIGFAPIFYVFNQYNNIKKVSNSCYLCIFAENFRV